MSGDRDQLAARGPLFVTRIIFGAMLSAVFIYVVVGVVVVSRGSAPETVSPAALTYALIGMGAMSAAMSFVVRGLMLRGKRAPAPPGSVPEPDYNPLNAAARPVSPAAAQRFVSAHVAAFAVCESAAIFGLVAAIMTRELYPLYVLALVSAAALAAHFPRRQALEELGRFEW